MEREKKLSVQATVKTRFIGSPEYKSRMLSSCISPRLIGDKIKLTNDHQIED